MSEVFVQSVTGQAQHSPDIQRRRNDFKYIPPSIPFSLSSREPTSNPTLLLPLSLRPRRHLCIFLVDLRISLISLILHHPLLLEVLDLHPNRQQSSVSPPGEYMTYPTLRTVPLKLGVLRGAFLP